MSNSCRTLGFGDTGKLNAFFLRPIPEATGENVWLTSHPMPAS